MTKLMILLLVSLTSAFGVAAVSLGGPTTGTTLAVGGHTGGGAPAPEIGAGVLGILLAGSVASYIRRRVRE